MNTENFLNNTINTRISALGHVALMHILDNEKPIEEIKRDIIKDFFETVDVLSSSSSSNIPFEIKEGLLREMIKTVMQNLMECIHEQTKYENSLEEHFEKLTLKENL